MTIPRQQRPEEPNLRVPASNQTAWQTARDGLAMLTRREVFVASALSVMILIGGLIEMVTLAAILPVITLIVEPEAALGSVYFERASEFVGLPPIERLLPMTIALACGLIVVSTAFNLLNQYGVQRFAMRTTVRLGKHLFRCCVAAPYAWFLTQNSALLTRRLHGDLMKWQGGLVQGLMLMFNNLVIAFFACAIVVVAAPVAGILALLVVGVLSAAVVLISRPHIHDLGHQQKLASEQLVKSANQIFSGIKDVKLSSRDHFFMRILDHWQWVRHRARLVQSLWQITPAMVMLMLGQVGYLGIGYIFWRSGMGSGEIAAQMVLLALVSTRLIPAFNRLTSNFGGFWDALPYVEGLVELERTAMTAREIYGARAHGKPCPVDWRMVRLTDVGFSYPGTPIASLSNVSLALERGKSYGIVGQSGAGKSTLIDVLMRLFEPTEGDILIDDTPLSEIDVKSWQARIGYVSQEPFIADDTLRANIAFGLAPEQVDDADVWSALEKAHLADIAGDLPDDLDTPLGERGLRLSGGQLQRVAIARALYKKPEILVLDEATSALDSPSEALVRATIEKLEGEVTTIVIAHRFTTIRRCDTIFVMDDGEVVAEGDYETLYKSNPLFRRLAAALQTVEPEGAEKLSA